MSDFETSSSRNRRSFISSPLFECVHPSRVKYCWRENILYRYRVSTLSGMASISPLMINPLHFTSFYFKYSLKFSSVSAWLYIIWYRRVIVLKSNQISWNQFLDLPQRRVLPFDQNLHIPNVDHFSLMTFCFSAAWRVWFIYRFGQK